MKRIRIIFFDIDGVLTDGNVYIDESGREIKAYRLTEIDAINDIVNDGYMVVGITGENTPIVELFEKKIAWTEFVRDCKDKLTEVKRLCNKYKCSPEDICYIGDGKYDILPIEYAGLGVCPQNAVRQVKDVADIVLDGFGGENCICELYDVLKKKDY